jgi:uncharacterized protein (TIGR00730 family)
MIGYYELMKKICVFTGASNGNHPSYVENAYKIGQMIASLNMGLVYGGGKMGLMGRVADGVIQAGGHVTGIIPRFLDNVEISHDEVTKLHILDTMHERKEMMYEVSDAFIVLPGGLGTLDEAMEIATWRQLGLHQKPVIIANLNGYWSHLLAQLQHIIDTGFMHHSQNAHFEQIDNLEALADRLQTIATETVSS